MISTRKRNPGVNLYVRFTGTIPPCVKLSSILWCCDRYEPIAGRDFMGRKSPLERIIADRHALVKRHASAEAEKSKKAHFRA